MIVSDVGKLACILVFVIGIFVLVASQVVQWGEAAPFLTLAAGYLFGNGETAVRKQAPSPMIVPNLNDHTVATAEGPAPAHITVTTTAGEITHGGEHGT
jgi:hypothetical protein